MATIDNVSTLQDENTQLRQQIEGNNLRLIAAARNYTKWCEQRDDLRRERDRWRQIAEDESWPFEWEVATELKQERDELRTRSDELEIALRYCWRKARYYQMCGDTALGLETIEKRIVESGVMGKEGEQGGNY